MTVARTEPVAVAIFVKTPGLSPVKTRLARDLGRVEAEHFHVLSARSVAAVVAQAAISRPLRPVWAVAEAEAVRHPLWAGFDCVPQGEGELGERIATVCATLFAEHRVVLLLGADSPQIPVSLLVDAVDRLLSAKERETPRSVLGRTPDGGFHLWGSDANPPRALWRRVPWSCGETATALAAELVAEGHELVELPVRADADTVDDLALVFSEFPPDCERPPEQRAMQAWLRWTLTELGR